MVFGFGVKQEVSFHQPVYLLFNQRDALLDGSVAWSLFLQITDEMGELLKYLTVGERLDHDVLSNDFGESEIVLRLRLISFLELIMFDKTGYNKKLTWHQSAPKLPIYWQVELFYSSLSCFYLIWTL